MIALILTLDHRRLEELVENFMESTDQASYNKVRNDYVNHIYWEEEFLFPKINNTTNLTILRSLEVEHGNMWILLDKVRECLNDVKEAQEKMREFMRVLLEHDGAEEGSVYQELDQLTDDEQAQLILEEIKIAVPPTDWKCKAIR